MKLTHWLSSLFERVAALIAGAAATHIQAAALKEQAEALAALEEQASQLEQRGANGAATRLREQAQGLSLTDAAALGAAALEMADHQPAPASALTDERAATATKPNRRKNRSS